MMLTALMLARMQFAFTVSFHFIFPSITIGLASYLLVLELLWLKTGRDVYLQLFRYWLKIFAITFGMGVVSGIVMAYQFGTNWAVFSDKAGPVIGPLMAYEVLTAFFLEAGFLGVMLFGLEKVGKKLHVLATGMVALRHLHFGILDHRGQQLDAHAGRLRHQRQWPILRHRLAGGDLQPVDALSPRPCHAGRVYDDGADRRRGRGLAFAQGPARGTAAERRHRHHVLDGDVDGDHRGTAADRRRPCPWREHAGIPASENRRDGRAFLQLSGRPRRRRTADPVRPSR